MNNKITIIIPVYNGEKYLHRCFNSIINQTYKNIEILIINDGSTDNSINIINEYKSKYPNLIRFFDNPNHGVAYTRNFAITKVTTDYFLFVDDDDYISLDLCEKLSEFINNKQIDIIKYKMEIVDKNNHSCKIDGPVFDKTSGEIAFNKLCFTDTMIDTPCLYLFNTEFFRTNNFSFLPNTYHEDFGLLPIIIIQSTTFISANIYGYSYYLGDNSITRTNNYTQIVKRANDLLLHYDNMILKIKNLNISSNTNYKIKSYYTNAILNTLNNLKDTERKQYKFEIKNRKLTKNIKIINIKQFLKRIFFIFKIYIFI